MTVSIAWTRAVLDYEQLVFVSDSRISGGATFDATPKILTLPRRDCAIAFAGASGHGFSMMLQLSLAIDAFPRARRGALEIATIRSHARKVFDAMSPLIKTSVKGYDEDLMVPGASFLFGGYSWRKKAFELWRISYSKGTHSFTADPAPTLCYDHKGEKLTTTYKPRQEQRRLSKVLFAGDQAAAKKLLFQRLSARIAAGDPPSRLDMEPFAVVRDMLRQPSLRMPVNSDTIGGAPQLVKVFQHHRSAPFAVFWPDRSGRPHLHGRPCLAYEHIDKQVIDPDTLEEVYLHAPDETPAADLESDSDDASI